MAWPLETTKLFSIAGGTATIFYFHRQWQCHKLEKGFSYQCYSILVCCIILVKNYKLWLFSHHHKYIFKDALIWNLYIRGKEQEFWLSHLFINHVHTKTQSIFSIYEPSVQYFINPVTEWREIGYRMYSLDIGRTQLDAALISYSFSQRFVLKDSKIQEE